jgi:hypothetical protein
MCYTLCICKTSDDIIFSKNELQMLSIAFAGNLNNWKTLTGQYCLTLNINEHTQNKDNKIYLTERIKPLTKRSTDIKK